MAIVEEESISGTDAGGSDIVLSSWTPASDDLILVGSLARTSSAKTVTVTGNGVTFTEIASILTNGNSHQITLHRGHNSSPSSGSITVSTAGLGSTHIAIAARFSGVDVTTSDGVEADANTTGPSGSDDDMLLSLTTLTDDAWLVGFGGARGALLTVPGGESAILIDITAGGGAAQKTAHMWREEVATAGSTQLGALNDLSGADKWNLILASVKPESGGTTTPQAVAGSLSFVGAPSLKVIKGQAGSASFLGALSKKSLLDHVGAASFSGDLSKLFFTSESGSLSFSGALSSVRFVPVVLSGALSFVGGLTLKLIRLLAASISFVGVFLYILSRSLVSSLSFSGSLASTKFVPQAVSGLLSFSGSVFIKTGLALNSVLSFVGVVGRSIKILLLGELNFLGDLLKGSPLTLLGVLSFSGALAKGLFYTVALAGVLSFSAILNTLITVPLTWVRDLIDSHFNDRSSEL